MTEVACNYYLVKNWDQINHYKCAVENAIIDDQKGFKLQGKHMTGKANKDVTAISFTGKSISRIPQGLLTCFPNLVSFEIRDSAIRCLTKNDLMGYKHLKNIFIESNFVEFLPGNLLKGFKNLEFFWFKSCNVLVEPSIFDGLVNLKDVNFMDGLESQLNFSKIRQSSSLFKTLDDLKNELFKIYFTSKNRLKFSHQSMTKHTLTDDYRKFLKNDKFKDFKIKIGNREFLVHKFLLAMRSPTLAEMIHKTPEAENLNLVDISVDTFEQILYFIYNDELHAEINDINLLHLLAAASRLNIELLKNIAIANIFGKINGENALSVLTLSNRLGINMLIEKAFKKIKGTHPFIIFPDDWANKPEILAKLIEIHKEKDEAMKKFADDYKKLVDSALGNKKS